MSRRGRLIIVGGPPASGKSTLAAVELHFLDEPREVPWQRVQKRAAEGEQPAPARDEFDAMLDELQPPDAREVASYDAPTCPAPVRG